MVCSCAQAESPLRFLGVVLGWFHTTALAGVGLAATDEPTQFLNMDPDQLMVSIIWSAWQSSVAGKGIRCLLDVILADAWVCGWASWSAGVMTFWLI